MTSHQAWRVLIDQFLHDPLLRLRELVHDGSLLLGHGFSSAPVVHEQRVAGRARDRIRGTP